MAVVAPLGDMGSVAGVGDGTEAQLLFAILSPPPMGNELVVTSLTCASPPDVLHFLVCCVTSAAH